MSERSKVEKMTTFSGGGKDGSRAVGDRGVPLQAVADQLLMFGGKRRKQDTFPMTSCPPSISSFTNHFCKLSTSLIGNTSPTLSVRVEGSCIGFKEAERERTSVWYPPIIAAVPRSSIPYW